MKSITYEQFTSALPDVVSGVLCAGDIIKVNMNGGGSFVLLDEPEYNIMLDALRMVFATAGSVEPDGKTIDVKKLLAKLGG